VNYSLLFFLLRDLQDNQTAFWDAGVISTVLKPYVLNLKIDTVSLFLAVQTSVKLCFLDLNF